MQPTHDAASGIGALAQYGAVGAILGLLLTLFLWQFKRMFDQLLRQNEQLLAQQNTLLAEIRSGVMNVASQISAMHNDLLQSMEGTASRRFPFRRPTGGL